MIAARAALAVRRPASAPAPVRRGVIQMTTASEKPGITNAKYWDAAAESWDDVQDTFATDMVKLGQPSSNPDLLLMCQRCSHADHSNLCAYSGA